MGRFRILSLDGGGIKGAFSAAALAVLEETTGHRCVDHFDLISGTSTGGIIAIGLGLGLSAREIANFYQEQGPIIFPNTSLVQRTAATIKQVFWGPKLSGDTLRDQLQLVFGERKFGESQCRLVIPTYDAIGGRIFTMKTAHDPRFQFDVDAPAVEVALATSAAPTFFKAAKFPRHEHASYVDGGVWANCPAMVALVEAVSFLNIPLDDIDILSIGTTTTPFSIADNAEAGVAEWNMGLVDVMFAGQVEASFKQAGLMTKGRLHRLDATVSSGDFTMDDARQVKLERLMNLGRSEAVKKIHLEDIQQRFLNGIKVAPFVPSL